MKNKLIVMCPTILRATDEWRTFLSEHPTIIKKANRTDLRIELLSGYKIYFRGEAEGKRALLGRYADIISVDVFVLRTKRQQS